MTAVPAEDLTVELVDRPKSECGDRCANAGYFANYSEGWGAVYPLPVGHLVADYNASREMDEALLPGSAGGSSGTGSHLTLAGGSMPTLCTGREISTLLISSGRARVEEIRTVPEGTDYAVSGIPVLRDGSACTTAQATAQGWDTSPLRATWHTLVGLKGDSMVVYVMGWQSRTANLLDSGEGRPGVPRGWGSWMCSN